MNRIRRIRRIAATMRGLACACLGMAVAAPAAFAQTLSSPGGGGMPASLVREALLHGEDLAPAPGPGSVPSFPVPAVTRTVMVGGMPGWQIALIAAGAALLAAALAVLADRVRAAHRTTAAGLRLPPALTEQVPVPLIFALGDVLGVSLPGVAMAFLP